MQNKRSQVYLQQRKLMVFLPVIIVPFMSVMFWLVGGGKGMAMVEKDGKVKIQGLNSSIPTVSDKTEIYSSKLKAYNNLGEDSIKKKKGNSLSMLEGGQLARFFGKEADSTRPKTLSTSGLNIDVNRTSEQRANAPEVQSLKQSQANLEHLNKVISTPSNSNSGYGSPVKMDPYLTKMMDEQSQRQKEVMEMYKKSMDKISGGTTSNAPVSSEVKPVENENASTGSGKKIKVKLDNDIRPVVTRLNSTLSIQENQVEKKDTSSKKSIAVVKGNQFNNPDRNKTFKEDPNVIAAAVHDEQTLIAGSTVKIRLLNSIKVGSTTIPKNTFIYGLCAFNNERLNIEITSIRYGEVIFPISLTVWDVDGIKGIFVPGSPSRTATKTGIGQGVSQGNFFQGYSNTVQTQLTQTGIETIKNIVSKKATLVRATLKANYKIYLKEGDN